VLGDVGAQIFAGDLRLTVMFVDAATYWWPNAVVFAAGRSASTTTVMRPRPPHHPDHVSSDTSTTPGAGCRCNHHGSIDQPE
jgi:hypothetical protein